MDVELILEQLSEHGLIRLNRIVGDYYSIYCPFHNDGNERRPSCGVLLHDQYKGGVQYSEGWFHCFSCGYTNDMVGAVTDILKSHSISKSGLDWLSENVPGFEAGNEFEYLVPQDMMKSLDSKYAVEYIQSMVNKPEEYVSEEELASYRYTVPYMYERKLTDSIIEEYDIGVDMNWIPPGRKKAVPCITFPVRNRDGKTLFFCRRSIEGKLYNYPQGVLKPLYGIDRVPSNCKSLIVCESCINALTARVYGYDAVALMGTGNSLQVDQLKQLGVHNIVLCMDGDDAGRRATAKLKRQLKSVAMVWVITMPDGKDLNDCSKEEFDKLYSERE